LTDFTNCNLNLGGPETHAKLTIYEDAVKGAVKDLKAKIAQQVYVIGNCKFLVDSQILNLTNKACFREELPLGSLGSKKLATSESSFTKSSRLATSEVCIRKTASRRHRHRLCIVRFHTSSLSESKLPEIRLVQE
jgi:hypothetical protein